MSPSSTRKDFIATSVKGFLVGASAVATLFLIADSASETDGTLRGGSDAPPTSETSHPRIDALNPTQSYVPSASPSTPIPTYNPTAEGEIPTDMPTQVESDSITTSVAKLRSSDETGFRLKLYWETGYYWQEVTTETFWCMSCPSGKKCKRNDKIKLRDCKTKSSRDAKFVASSTGKGHQFRIINTNLCLQKSRRGPSIKLKRCNTKNKFQHFVGFMPDADRFDLRPSTGTKRCLSQHHHPRSGEIVYAETCSKAHRFDTGYWVTY